MSDGEDSEMSFTSGENDDEQALLTLISDSKKPVTKEKKKKDKVEVQFNNDSLEGFNVESKKLLKNDESMQKMKDLFVTEDANAVME